MVIRSLDVLLLEESLLTDRPILNFIDGFIYAYAWMLSPYIGDRCQDFQ